LEDTDWILTSLKGGAPIPGTEITLAIEGGEATGSTGCNTYFGSYTVGGTDTLTISPLGSTEMACLEPEGNMEQETENPNALRAATSFRLSATELEVHGAGGALLTFNRAE